MHAPPSDHETASKVGARKIRGYYGTPREIREFDPNQIVLGFEPSFFRAYGWGLYFVENKSVAEEYRTVGDTNMLVDGRPMIFKGRPSQIADSEGFDHLSRTSIEDLIKKTHQRCKGDLKATKTALAELASSSKGTGYSPNAYFLIRKAKRIVVPPGNLYEVEIDADAGAFIEFEKPLSEQSKIVRAGLTDIYPLIAQRMLKEDSGNDQTWPDRAPIEVPDAPAWKFHYALAHGTNHNAPLKEMYAQMAARHLIDPDASDEEKASRLLLLNGIAGVRYVDSKLRELADGSHKFVVFDPKAVNVVSKNGLPITRRRQMELF
jgi:hypothetical protein